MTVLQAERDIRLERAYNQSVPGPTVHPLDARAALGAQQLEQFETRFDPTLRAIWCYMRPPGRPIVTQALLDELALIQDQTRAAHALRSDGADAGFSFFVFGSRSPGVFSLGGDLAMFTRCVRTRDRAYLHNYARSCVDIIYQNINALHLPVVTVGLVQGDALGGGFETAMSFDVLVAERGAKFCLPESLFNLFPGMGAYSLLTRKVGPVVTERLVSGAKMHTAEELHSLGVVDILAEDGQGEVAVAAYIRKASTRLNARLAMNAARRRVNPVTHEELRDIVDVWTEAVFGISELHLRKMDRLVSAQVGRIGRLPAGGG